MRLFPPPRRGLIQEIRVSTLSDAASLNFRRIRSVLRLLRPTPIGSVRLPPGHRPSHSAEP